MKDPRDKEYAKLLVDTCIDVQPGWQVLVLSGTLGKPLFDEVCKAIADRGAYALPRVQFEGFMSAPNSWIKAASDELLGSPAPLEEHTLLNVDALVAIVAPENTRQSVDIEATGCNSSRRGLTRSRSA